MPYLFNHQRMDKSSFKIAVLFNILQLEVLVQFYIHYKMCWKDTEAYVDL